MAGRTWDTPWRGQISLSPVPLPLPLQPCPLHGVSPVSLTTSRAPVPLPCPLNGRWVPCSPACLLHGGSSVPTALPHPRRVGSLCPLLWPIHGGSLVPPPWSVSCHPCPAPSMEGPLTTSLPHGESSVSFPCPINHRSLGPVLCSPLFTSPASGPHAVPTVCT